MKKILISAAVIVVLLTSLVTVKTNNGLNAIAQQNIEAIAQNEHGIYDYPDGYAIVTKCGVSLGSWYDKCTATIVICAGGGAGCNEKQCPVHKE